METLDRVLAVQGLRHGEAVGFKTLDNDRSKGGFVFNNQNAI